jgi:hypothetical protein
MVQAAVLDGLVFDAHSFGRDGFDAAEVDVSRCEVADALVVAVFVVVVDKGGNGRFELRSEEDMSAAIELTIGVTTLVAQAEREAISRRTKEALAVAKARGVRLGNPNGAEALRRAGRGAVALRAAVVGNADRHAEDLRAVVEDIKSEGMVSLRAIAAALNARGMLTRRGGPWQVSNVGNLVRRLEAGRSTEPKSIGVRGDERSGRTEKPDTRLQS